MLLDQVFLIAAIVGMSWLLWREYRRNRWILAVGAAGVLLPIIIAVVFDLNGSPGFIGPFFLSCVLSQVTVALLAGNTVAGERFDRSAEAIGDIPLRRSKTFASKPFFPVIAVVASCIVYLWGGTQVVLPKSPMAHLPGLFEFVSGFFLVYSVAWLLTSYLSSAAIVSCIGFVAPLLLVLPLIVSVEIGDGTRLREMGREEWLEFASLHAMLCLIVAALCFSVGTWNYFRSSES